MSHDGPVGARAQGRRIAASVATGLFDIVKRKPRAGRVPGSIPFGADRAPPSARANSVVRAVWLCGMPVIFLFFTGAARTAPWMRDPFAVRRQAERFGQTKPALPKRNNATAGRRSADLSSATGASHRAAAAVVFTL